MFGWLKRKVQITSVNAMGTDIDRFIVGLRGASAEEIGGMLACTYHWMEFLERKFGWNLDHPDLVMVHDIYASMTVGKCARHIQSKEPAMAAGLIVWLHTLRASSTPELRLRGRELWSQLNRGAEHVQRGAEMFRAVIGIELNLSCRGRTPKNLGSADPKTESAVESTEPAKTPADGADDDRMHNDVTWLVRVLQAQMLFLSRFKDVFPSDDFSIGYVFGAVDAQLQARGVGADDVSAWATLSLVFFRLYGDAFGATHLARALNYQTVEGAVKEGIHLGGSEMWECLRTLKDEKTEFPMGLARYHLGEHAA